jgi:hypothetical protein
LFNSIVSDLFIPQSMNYLLATVPRPPPAAQGALEQIRHLTATATGAIAHHERGEQGPDAAFDAAPHD